uniref:Uncharacterized protein n=1 Tax=Arundo donax TaxID=35708 RepID=A0A0A9CG75_ARUDO
MKSSKKSLFLVWDLRI